MAIIQLANIMMRLTVAASPAEGAPLSPLLGFSSSPNPGKAGIDAAGRWPTNTAADVLHVDCATGSDEARGTATAPFKTLQHALVTVAARATRGSSNTSTSSSGGGGAQHGGGSTAAPRPLPAVQLAEGVCHLSAPLRLGPELPPTILRGHGPRSVLSGGKELAGWKPAAWPGAPAGAVFEVDISGWPTEIKTLRHGAALPPRARFPKLDGDGLGAANFLFAQAWSTHPAGKTTSDRRLHGLGLDRSQLPPRTNVSALVGSFAHVLGCVEMDVNSQLTKVLSVGGGGGGGSDKDNNNVTLEIEFRNSFTLHQRFYLENVRFALSPGEFFVDDAAGKLFYWPALPTAGSRTSIGGGGGGDLAGENPNLPTGVVAPVMDRLVELDRSHHHLITNLTFTDTTYYADGYWDGPAQQPSDAAIRINYADGVTVSNCQFLGGLGGYGVAVGNASTGTTVTGSLFDSVGQGGVIAYGYDQSPVPRHPGQAAGNNSQPRGLTVSYNVMQNIGRVLINVAGVAFRAASDSVVAHNRIHKTPRYGLQADSFYATPPPDGSGKAGSGLISSGNVFEYNIISETNRYTTDTGAIEMLGSGDPGLIGWWNNKCVRACVPQY